MTKCSWKDNEKADCDHEAIIRLELLQQIEPGKNEVVYLCDHHMFDFSKIYIATVIHEQVEDLKLLMTEKKSES